MPASPRPPPSSGRSPGTGSFPVDGPSRRRVAYRLFRTRTGGTVPPKYFTVGEANALLPSLRPILQRIAEKRRELQAKREALAAFRRQAAGNGHHLASPDFLALRKEADFIGEEMQAEIQNVHDLGC